MNCSKITFLFLIAISLSASYAKYVLAEINQESKQQIEGEISFINPVSMTVVTDHDKVEGAAKEIVLMRNEDIRYVSGQRWDDLKVGDQVKVNFSDFSDDETLLRENGSVETVKVFTHRKLNQITFLQPKTTSLNS